MSGDKEVRSEEDRWLKAETDTAYLMMKAVPPEEQDRRILEHYAKHGGLVHHLWNASKLRQGVWSKGGDTKALDEAIRQGVDQLKRHHRKALGIALDWEKPLAFHSEPADRIAHFLSQNYGFEGPRPPAP
jgi:hypothetical protein